MQQVAALLALLGVAAGAPISRRLQACADGFRCSGSSLQCIDWRQVGDGINDCPLANGNEGGNSEDETAGKILYCPRQLRGSGAVGYLTFAADLGKDYATLHKQDSQTALPCLKSWYFDADGNGLKEYTSCTKVCTDTSDVNLVKSLNPDNQNTQSVEYGCKERGINSNSEFACAAWAPGTEAANGCQDSRLWCATSLNGDGLTPETSIPKTAAYCTNPCTAGVIDVAQQDKVTLTETDTKGDACNKLLVMPWLSATDDMAGLNLNWTFTNNAICKQRNTNVQNCAKNQQETDPRATGLRYYLQRGIGRQDDGVHFTVYHQNSPQKALHSECTRENPTCCEFAIRIMDAEDPALMYPPFGPKQTLSRCQDVTVCDSCKYESSQPSASSDRVCSDKRECSNCEYETSPGNAFTDRTCQPLSICTKDTYMLSDSKGDPIVTTQTDACSQKTMYVSNVQCPAMAAKCDPTATPPMYDAARQDGRRRDKCGMKVYIADRECKCVTTCTGQAKEVWAPRTYRDPTDECLSIGCEDTTLCPGDSCPTECTGACATQPWVERYEGDRVCQCPDPPWQSDRDDSVSILFTPQTSTDFIGAVTDKAMKEFLFRGKCTATVADPAEKAKCAAVTGAALDDGTECAKVMLAAGTARACTYLTAAASKGANRGVHFTRAGSPRYEPNTFFGTWNAQTCKYGCSACETCHAGTYVDRKCTHARLNMDYCTNLHPAPKCTEAQSQASDSACWSAADNVDETETINFTTALNWFTDDTDYGTSDYLATLYNSYYDVAIPLYPVSRIGVFAVLSHTEYGEPGADAAKADLYRTFKKYCFGGSYGTTPAMLVESIAMREFDQPGSDSHIPSNSLSGSGRGILPLCDGVSWGSTAADKDTCLASKGVCAGKPTATTKAACAPNNICDNGQQNGECFKSTALYGFRRADGTLVEAKGSDVLVEGDPKFPRPISQASTAIVNADLYTDSQTICSKITQCGCDKYQVTPCNVRNSALQCQFQPLADFLNRNPVCKPLSLPSNAAGTEEYMVNKWVCAKEGVVGDRTVRVQVGAATTEAACTAQGAAWQHGDGRAKICSRYKAEDVGKTLREWIAKWDTQASCATAHAWARTASATPEATVAASFTNKVPKTGATYGTANLKLDGIAQTLPVVLYKDEPQRAYFYLAQTSANTKSWAEADADGSGDLSSDELKGVLEGQGVKLPQANDPLTKFLTWKLEQMDADVPRDSKISEHEYSRYFADAYLGCYMDTALNVAGDRIVCEVGEGDVANDAGYSYEWVDQVVFDRVIATRSTCDQANCQYIKAEGESQPECTGQGISFFIMDRVCADAELCQATEYNDLRYDANDVLLVPTCKEAAVGADITDALLCAAVADADLDTAAKCEAVLTSSAADLAPTCKESAAGGDAVDALLCAKVVGANLADKTACEAVLTNSATDAAATRACAYTPGAKACTYTPAGSGYDFKSSGNLNGRARACQALTVCGPAKNLQDPAANPGGTYETVAPLAVEPKVTKCPATDPLAVPPGIWQGFFTDRQCTCLLHCDPASASATAASTDDWLRLNPTEDRDCECQAGHYSPALTTACPRVYKCQKCTVCKPFQYETRECTTNQDRQCENRLDICDRSVGTSITAGKGDIGIYYYDVTDDSKDFPLDRTCASKQICDWSTHYEDSGRWVNGAFAFTPYDVSVYQKDGHAGHGVTGGKYPHWDQPTTALHHVDSIALPATTDLRTYGREPTDTTTMFGPTQSGGARKDRVCAPLTFPAYNQYDCSEQCSLAGAPADCPTVWEHTSDTLAGAADRSFRGVVLDVVRARYVRFQATDTALSYKVAVGQQLGDRSATNADYNGGCESKLDGTCNPRHADLAANRARLQKDIASDLGAPLGLGGGRSISKRLEKGQGVSVNGAVTLDLGLGGNSAPGQDGGSNVDYATVTLTAPMAAATCKEAAEVSATPDATACAGVTGAQLLDKTACEAIVTASPADAAATQACVYAPVVSTITVSYSLDNTVWTSGSTAAGVPKTGRPFTIDELGTCTGPVGDLACAGVTGVDLRSSTKCEATATAADAAVKCTYAYGTIELNAGETRMRVEDRKVCGLTECLCNQYQTMAPTYTCSVEGVTDKDQCFDQYGVWFATTDRRCDEMRTCTDDEYESQYPTKQFLDDQNTVFVYTSQRECASFADYNSALVQPGVAIDATLYDKAQWAQDTRWFPGDVDVGGKQRPTRADDCLPFYHIESVAAGTWHAQYWNAFTVRATLPDAVVSTDAGACYYTPPAAPAAGVLPSRTELKIGHRIQSEDNFFFQTFWSQPPGAAGFTSKLGAPENRVKITVFEELEPDTAGQPIATRAMTKDSGTTKHLIGDSVLGSAVGQQFPVSSTPPVFLPTCREASAVSDATDKLLCSTTAQSNRAACEGHLTTSAADAPATRACVWNAWTAQTCHDANAYRIVDGLNQYYYDPQQSEWSTYNAGNRNNDQDFAHTSCAVYRDRGNWCQLYGSRLNPNNVPASDGCCVCGGGQRATGHKLLVTARDSGADAKPQGSALAEPAAHYDAHYDGPTADWCVAQRVDTATFQLYVFDKEKPVLACAATLVQVCNDGGGDPATCDGVGTKLTEQQCRDGRGECAGSPAITTKGGCPDPANQWTSKAVYVAPVPLAGVHAGHELNEAKDYATVYITRAAPGTAILDAPCSTNTLGDGPCVFYPSGVTDNVDANVVDAVGAGRTDLAQWDAASLIKTECADDLTGMKAYETAPKVDSSIKFSGPTSRVSGVINPQATVQLRIGKYTATFTATDTYKNTGTCEMQLEVVDCAPPRMTCKDQNLVTSPGVCYCTYNGNNKLPPPFWPSGLPATMRPTTVRTTDPADPLVDPFRADAQFLSTQATDNSGIPPHLTLEDKETRQVIDPDFKFKIGDTKVTSKATDMSGALCTQRHLDLVGADKTNACAQVGEPLSSTCELTVTCVDTEPPVLPACNDVQATCDDLTTAQCPDKTTCDDYATVTFAEGWPAGCDAGKGECSGSQCTPGQDCKGGVILDPNSGATDNSGFVTRATYTKANGDAITNATKFSFFDSTRVIKTVTDMAGNTATCSFDVQVDCMVGEWRRKESFEIPALDECALVGAQTCFGKSLLGTAAAPYVAGDYVAPGFITLPQAAGARTLSYAPVAGACTPSDPDSDECLAVGFDTSWKPFITATSKWDADLPTARNSLYDNRGLYVADTETFDCDDTGVVRNVNGPSYLAPQNPAWAPGIDVTTLDDGHPIQASCDETATLLGPAATSIPADKAACEAVTALYSSCSNPATKEVTSGPGCKEANSLSPGCDAASCILPNVFADGAAACAALPSCTYRGHTHAAGAPWMSSGTKIGAGYPYDKETASSLVTEEGLLAGTVGTCYATAGNTHDGALPPMPCANHATLAECDAMKPNCAFLVKTDEMRRDNAHFPMGEQYFAVSDPDGVVKVDLAVVKIPRPNTKNAFTDQRWYRYSYQVHGAAKLTVSITGTKRSGASCKETAATSVAADKATCAGTVADPSKTVASEQAACEAVMRTTAGMTGTKACVYASAEDTVKLTETVCQGAGATDQPVAGLPNYHLDAVCDTGDWVHVEQRFGASSLASSATPFQATAPPASWADWSSAKLSVQVECTDAATHGGCADANVYFDAFAIGLRGCTDRSATNFDPNAVFEYPDAECMDRTKVNGAFQNNRCCNYDSCCSTEKAKNAQGQVKALNADDKDECAVARHSESARQNRARNGATIWEGCWNKEFGVGDDPAAPVSTAGDGTLGTRDCVLTKSSETVPGKCANKVGGPAGPGCDYAFGTVKTTAGGYTLEDARAGNLMASWGGCTWVQKENVHLDDIEKSVTELKALQSVMESDIQKLLARLK